MTRGIRAPRTLPAPTPGFLGAGHTAIEVVTPDALAATDPFVLLMDDRLDLGPGVRKMGEAHPHAGLETVTLLLEGRLADRDEGDPETGDAQWMTAGRGVIHSENIHAEGKLRILQLWIRLPKAAREVDPRVQIIKWSSMPIRREPGVEARLYSGTSGALVSPTKNYATITLVDFLLEPNATITQALPASYNGFLYALEGAGTIGADRTPITSGQVAWLDRPTAVSGDSDLAITAGGSGLRVVLYAGQPQNEPLMHYGPFVGGSPDEINRLFQTYRAGRFARLSELPQT